MLLQCNENSGVYRAFGETISAEEILEVAQEIVNQRYATGFAFCDPARVGTFLKHKLGPKEREVFAVMFLDTSNRLLAFEEMFLGTINSATIHPREIVRRAMQLNAVHIIVSHNHPSGDPTPSRADLELTKKISAACSLVGVDLIDHVVVGRSTYSFRENGNSLV